MDEAIQQAIEALVDLTYSEDEELVYDAACKIIDFYAQEDLRAAYRQSEEITAPRDAVPSDPGECPYLTLMHYGGLFG